MYDHSWWSYIRFDKSQSAPRVDRQLLRRVFSYAWPYRASVAVVLTTIIVTSLLELIPPLLYRALIDTILPEGNVMWLNLTALALVAIPILTGLINVLQRHHSARAGEGIIHDLRQQMYGHLQKMSLRFFTHTKAGEIVSRFNNDVVGAQNAITGTIPNIVTNTVVLVSTLVIMIMIDWRLTLLSVVVTPLFLLPARRVGVILRSIRRAAMEHNAEMSTIINETLSINGALLVKTFGSEERERERFEKSNVAVRDIGVRRAQVGQWFFMGLSISGAIGTALVYWAGGHLVLDGALTIGTIVAFVAYLYRLYGPISALSNVQVEFVTSMVSFERVFDYLDKPIDIQEQPDALQLTRAVGRVEFDHVSFSYLDDATLAEKNAGDQSAFAVGGNGATSESNGAGPISLALRLWALQDVSFVIEPGQLAALVGPSGAGKTTVTYLLPRLYDPSAGRILLDGHDLRSVTLASLAGQIGMVTQETYLFHDTVRANLLYARPGATQEEIESACRAAYIHDRIAAMPDGYETVVGERGYRLSGGEKQRLAIARVILKDPAILVLDEATSHLDSQSETYIQAALQPLLAGRTSLVIAHRLSTILAADVILVMAQGRLVEVGAHRDLLARGGLYAELYETQFRTQTPENVLGDVTTVF
jgi:ATP-binding cassette subfamily B protein